jgi:hypothetical protein
MTWGMAMRVAIAKSQATGRRHVVRGRRNLLLWLFTGVSVWRYEVVEVGA